MTRKRSILSEYVYFVRAHMLWWIVPLVLIMAVLVALLFKGRDSAEPFLYAF